MNVNVFRKAPLPLRLIGLLTLVWLSGCASGAVVTPDGASQSTEPAIVERLEEGRVGFVIREVSQLDGELRDSFSAGIEAMEAQNYALAVASLETVVEAEPQVSAPYINLAIAYRFTEQREKAQQPLKRALELVPGHPLASQEYAHLLRSSGDFNGAREILAAALEVFPEYYPLHKNLAILCDLYLGDLACAYEHYDAYRAAQPDDAEVEIWLAELQMRLER